MIPSRSLFSVTKPLRYVPAVATDVRRTWRKFRLLERVRRAPPNACPECGGWISADGWHSAHRIECPHFPL